MNVPMTRYLCMTLSVVFLLLISSATFAQESDSKGEKKAEAEKKAAVTKTEDGKKETTKKEEEKKNDPTPNDILGYVVDNFILFMCAVLVLFMQAGFAMLEAGLNAAKNTVNILCKNVMDLCVGACLFFVVGYGLMYPADYLDKPPENKYIAFGGSGIAPTDDKADIIGGGTFSPQVGWLFQVAFAATAATIVSGAVAGRMKFGSYLIYSAILTGLIYPISGYWVWGLGWLDAAGFHDFAGSIIVHAVGGFAGLAGAIVLGPRIGRFVKGKSVPMPGHNLGFAALGVFILWVGWYGFNPGSKLGFTTQADINLTMKIAVNTTLAAAIGGVVALFTAWILFKKPDLSMALNGILGGLVGITANCDCVTNIQALMIGAIAGVIVVLAIILLDKLKIDDPVGAFPVHGACGVWGGIATGIFSEQYSIVTQLKGTVAICAWSFITMLALFLALKAMGVLRVSPEEELVGLDISEHGMHAYPPSMIADSFSATVH